jgi:hypothetical protein
VKNYGCFVPAFGLGLALFSVTHSCPMFVEFYPDPKDVSDKEGEYVEIRLDDFRAESLFVRFESKEVLSFAWPDAERLVLVHDSSQCAARTSAQGSLQDSLRNEPQSLSQSGLQSGLRNQDAPQRGVVCGSLGNTTLPNSRESAWKLWAGTCVDSVTVPRPKPGKTIQRVGMTDEWTFADRASGVQDNMEQDSLMVARMFAGGTSVLRVTEVHHCPEEPMPEWVELHNASAYAFPLDAFRFCDRGGVLGQAGDSIRSFQTVLVSKDTASLRAALGIPDIKLIQVSLGFLNNVEGTLRLCFRNDVVDSVVWKKGEVACPSGFNPLTGRREFTPGYQSKNTKKVGAATATNTVSSQDLLNAPFTYKLSSRVISKRGKPLRVRVESENDVTVSLLDSAGRRVWKSVVSAMSNGWVNVPVQVYLGIGVGYVTFSAGEYENVVGILVRP